MAKRSTLEEAKTELVGDSLAQDAFKRVKQISKQPEVSITNPFPAQMEAETTREVVVEEKNVTENLRVSPDRVIELMVKSAIGDHALSTAKEHSDLRTWVVKTVGDYKVSTIKWIIGIILAAAISLAIFFDQKLEKVYGKITEEIKSIKDQPSKSASGLKPPQKR
jgi:hypothetical protein